MMQGGVRVRPAAFALSAVFVIAAALRFYRLGTVPLWTDELFTATYPRLGLDYLWSTGLRTEPTSPLYYTLIWSIEQIAGASSLTLRLPSVFASLAAIGLTAALARELSPRPIVPVLAALLLALAPTDIFFAQEARAYALQIAALALALLGLARVLVRGRGVVLYVAGAVLAVWLHPTSLIAVAALNLGALAGLLGRPPLLRWPVLRRWCFGSVVVALFCLPLLPVLLSSDAAVATAWIEHFSRWSFEGLIGSTLAGPALGAYALRIAELGVPLLAALFLVPLWRPGRPAAIVLLLVPGVFLAAMIGISLVRPVLLSRTIAWMLVPLSVALADMLMRRHPVFRFAVLGVLSIATAVHLAKLGTLKEDWRSFLARLPGLSPPALIVLAPHTSPAAFEFYATGAGVPVRLDDGLPPMPETIVTQRAFGTRTITTAEMEQAIAAGRPVWLVYRRPEYEWMRRATAGLPSPRLAVQDIAGTNPGIRALRW